MCFPQWALWFQPFEVRDVQLFLSLEHSEAIVGHHGCSVAQSCLTFCSPMDCSTPGFPVLHHLLELAQTLVRWVSDATQPSCSLSSPSLLAFNLSQHQGLFQLKKRTLVGLISILLCLRDPRRVRETGEWSVGREVRIYSIYWLICFHLWPCLWCSQLW